MFKKFANIENRAERLEIYNILKFNLVACQKLVELLLLAVMVSGLAWQLSEPLMKLGFWAGSALAIGVMVLVLWAMRLPLILAKGQLKADFGLDPRPLSRRIREMVSGELRWAAFFWVTSVIVFWGLKLLDLWAWTLATMGLGLALTIFDAYYPRFRKPLQLRELLPDELASPLLAKIAHWKDQTGLSSEAFRVSSTFSAELEVPYLSGLGGAQKLIIPEKALAIFPPREMAVLVVSAAISSLVKMPLKMLFLRFCALAVAMPLAAILISTLGPAFWLYPMAINPPLIAMGWCGLWLGYNMAEFTIRLTQRGMETQLAAAASVLLKDEEAVALAAETLAVKNLEEDKIPAWREIFLARYSRAVFVKKAKYHQYMSKFNDKKQ